MAVSKRLRYEVMNRDNFACRYCGADDVKLTIDHVIPVTLGGSDEPSNLVTACTDCNAGKSSSHPDAPIVEGVSDDSLRWAAVVKEAAELQAANRDQFGDYVEAFDEKWKAWSYGSDGKMFMSRPYDWHKSVQQFFNAGLEIEALCDCVDIAGRANVADYRVWRYFCGVCWRVLRERQEIARALFEKDKGDSE
jgi:hypothetical protein